MATDKTDVQRQTSLEVAQQVASQSHLNPAASSFVPRFRPSEKNVDCELSEAVDSLSLNSELRQMLDTVAAQPEQYVVLRQEMLSALSRDGTSITSGVDLLVTKAVNEPNIQYSVALFCQHCCQSLPTDSGFKQIFLKRLHSEHSRLASATDPATYPQFENFTRLMAEIFLVLKKNDGSRNETLREGIQKLIKILIDRQTESSVKAAVQTLKLAGAAMAEDESAKNSGSSPATDALMNSLKQLSQSGSISGRLTEQVNSLLRLCSSNWGRNDSVSADQRPHDQQWTIDPVYYDPGGRPLSWAELHQLQEEQNCWPTTSQQRHWYPQQMPVAQVSEMSNDWQQPQNSWPIDPSVATAWSAGDRAEVLTPDSTEAYNWPHLDRDQLDVNEAAGIDAVLNDSEFDDAYEEFLKETGQVG